MDLDIDGPITSAKLTQTAVELLEEAFKLANTEEEAMDIYLAMQDLKRAKGRQQ